MLFVTPSGFEKCLRIGLNHVELASVVQPSAMVKPLKSQTKMPVRFDGAFIHFARRDSKELSQPGWHNEESPEIWGFLAEVDEIVSAAFVRRARQKIHPSRGAFVRWRLRPASA
jgi:hypothetical protein